MWEMFDFPENVCLPGQEPLTSFYFHRGRGLLSLKYPEDTPDCYGGILSDEMGLGKTGTHFHSKNKFKELDTLSFHQRIQSYFVFCKMMIVMACSLLSLDATEEFRKLPIAPVTTLTNALPKSKNTPVKGKAGLKF